MRGIRSGDWTMPEEISRVVTADELPQICGCKIMPLMAIIDAIWRSLGAKECSHGGGHSYFDNQSIG